MKIFNKKREIIFFVVSIIYILVIILFKDIFIGVSIFLLLGFFILIFGFLLFINLNKKKLNDSCFNIHFLSENGIKFILLFFLTFSLLISPILSYKSIIIWERIPFFNYTKAMIAILGYAFLPGAVLYNIIFPRDLLSKKFDIEPFLIKITIYPLLSFGFLGTLISIFDQLGLFREQIEIILYLTILILFCLELSLGGKRAKSIEIKFTRINISKYSSIIILFAIGVSTISLGLLFGWNYLISGDPWGAIKYANLIADPGKTPLYMNKYPNFWGYISYGFSIISGLPFINVNSFLAPFSYLFITSIYLFMKSVLHNYKTKYAVLSTILISMFSGFLIQYLESTLTLVCEFYFIYKSYSYFLLFTSLAVAIKFINSINNNNSCVIKSFKRIELKSIILSSYFLILSYMVYMLPLLIGITFLLFYSLFSEKNKKYMRLNFFILNASLIFVFFLIYDLILNFFLSYIIIEWILTFFTNQPILNILSVIPPPLFFYSIFLIFLFIIFITNKLFYKNSRGKKSIKRRIGVNSVLLIKLVLIIFTVFLFLGMINFFLNLQLGNVFFFFLFLDNIYLNIGFIGILGIYFSFYCFKIQKNLFYRLMAWILFSFIFAFLLICLEMIINFPLGPISIPSENSHLMNHWFNRIWFYSIPSLTILTSIGFYEFIKRFNKYWKLKNKKYKLLLRNVIAINIILFSFSGVIQTGILYGNSNFRYSNAQIETLDWISENIPIHSGVVVGDNFFMGVGTDTITFVRQYFFYDIFKVEFNETRCIEQIGFLKNNTIQYAIISQFFITYYLNKSNFVNNILVPDFYNITLYNNGDLTVYYASFFD